MIIFDLDGTILDTLEDLCSAVNRALKKYGFTPISVEDTRWRVGNGVLNLLKRCVPDGTDEGLLEKMYEGFLVDYKENCAVKTKPYEGIIEVLEQLKKDGVKLAVISNKFDAAVQDLMNKYFPGIFDFVAGEQDGYRKKPAPDLLNRTMEVLGVTREETILVGDGDADVKSAINAGIQSVCVLWGFRDREFLEKCGGRIFVEEIEDLLPTIRELNLKKS